jgi:hypothetical protein
LFEDKTSKFCYKWLMAGSAQCISGKLQCDNYNISKHRTYALCIHWEIPWPPPVMAWSSGQHKFNKSAYLWRGGFTCYSDSIVKFTSSRCLQINGLDHINDVDKFQLDVKISVTSHSNYLELLTVDETKFTLEPLPIHCRTKEQQLDYKALKFSEGKWSSTAHHIRKPSELRSSTAHHIRKPSELNYPVGTRKAPLLRIASSVFVTLGRHLCFELLP